MFAWLAKRLPYFRPQVESQRQIFHYWDGRKERSIDPIVALLSLENHPTYRGDVHPEKVDQGDPEATRITVQAVRDVFGVSEWSEAAGGLTILESLALLTTFCDYLEAVKKNTGPSVISPSPTVLTFPAHSETTTKASSASG